MKYLALLLGSITLLCTSVAFGLEQTYDWPKMKAITPRGYVCYRATGPITIDGKADEPDWQKVPWTEDFADIEGPSKPAPRFRTRAKMLWDDNYLYVHAELRDPHVWGTITKKNEVIFNDNDFEVFINPDASNHNYYEYEMNALNTIWELTLDRPYRDDGPVHLGTNLEGLKSAVHVNGTLNDPSDSDQGWSVEIAFPFKDLKKYAKTAQCPPADGQQWRIDFSRVEWVIDIIDGKYVKVPHRPEDNWVWSPQGVIDMHRPERWGYVQFSDAEPGAVQLRADATLPVRDLLMEVYHRQRDFKKTSGSYASSLDELKMETRQVEPMTGPLAFAPTDKGFVATAEFKLGDAVQKMHVSQDSHLWSEGEAPKVAAPPAGLGKTDPEITEAVAEVSEENVTAILKKLESFETRNTMSDPTQPNRGVGAARQWILEQFQSYSPRLQVSFDTHQIPKGGRVFKDIELKNVVAILPGKQDPDRWIIVSGHYDSLNLKVPQGSRPWTEQTTELTAPGVSDDGSGTACAMEAARVLSQHEFPATLVFVAFAGEEQGLIGSRAMAKRVKAKSQEIEAILNNDIIGNDVAGNGVNVKDRVLVFSDDPSDSPSRQIARYVQSTALEYFPEMHADTIFRRDRFGRGGDQTSFNAEGYAGVRFTTASENFTNQHSPTDTLANASPSYTTKVIKVNVASAASLASAPRSPITRAPSVPLRNRPGLTRGTGYDAVMRWQQPGKEDDVAGFVITTRSTTAATWEKQVWVGKVHEYSMKDVPIDQLVFGVKAVDHAGHESPVSAYSLPPFLTGGSAD